MLTDQRDQLLRGNQKRDRINKSKQAQNDKTCQPIRISSAEKPCENAFGIHDIDIGTQVVQTFNAQ